MRDLTALVLTYNEEENIGRTLSSISWIEKVVVLDSYSTDETAKIARTYPNVVVAQRKFDDHTSQWNFGLEQVATPWVLSLDADYQLSDRLAAEIQQLNWSEEIAGYAARFEYRIFGKSLRASVYPPRVVLFRRDHGRYMADGHTQLLKIDGSVGELHSPIYHDDRKPLSRWIQSQDSYAKLEARYLLNVDRGLSVNGHQLSGGTRQLKPQDRLRLAIYFAPVVMFFYLLFGRGLILDGWRGWYYVAQRVIAELLLSLRLLSEKHNLEQGE